MKIFIIIIINILYNSIPIITKVVWVFWRRKQLTSALLSPFRQNGIRGNLHCTACWTRAQNRIDLSQDSVFTFYVYWGQGWKNGPKWPLQWVRENNMAVSKTHVVPFLHGWIKQRRWRKDERLRILHNCSTGKRIRFISQTPCIFQFL